MQKKKNQQKQQKQKTKKPQTTRKLNVEGVSRGQMVLSSKECCGLIHAEKLRNWSWLFMH